MHTRTTQKLGSNRINGGIHRLGEAGSGNSARLSRRLAPLVAAALGWASPLQADSIPIPNGSFESPVVPPAFPALPGFDSWQQAPNPGVPVPPGFTWEQFSGQFPNAGDASHIDNMDGNQAAYLFNIPGVGIFQDLSATYGVGSSYSFTLGLTGTGGIPDGSALSLLLYYRDAGNNMQILSGTGVNYSGAAFPNNTHFFDYSVNLPAVQAGDAWAGKNIGVEVLATQGTGAGYWDADNARLVQVPEPATVGLLALGLGAFGLVFRARRRT